MSLESLQLIFNEMKNPVNLDGVNLFCHCGSLIEYTLRTMLYYKDHKILINPSIPREGIVEIKLKALIAKNSVHKGGRRIPDQVRVNLAELFIYHMIPETLKNLKVAILQSG